MALDPRLLAVLACPEDKGPLYYLGDEDGLYNPRLHRRYVVRDGIPVMLIDEAVPVDDTEHEAIMSRIGADGIAPTFAAYPFGGVVGYAHRMKSGRHIARLSAAIGLAVGAGIVAVPGSTLPVHAVTCPSLCGGGEFHP